MSKTIVKIDLSESPYKNDMIHNRWHPDVPIIAWVKPGEDFVMETYDWTGGFIKNNESADVVRGFVVLDETPGPIVGLHHEIFARLHPCDDRHVRMPAVVDHVVLVGRFGKVNLHDRLGHVSSFRANSCTFQSL